MRWSTQKFRRALGAFAGSQADLARTLGVDPSTVTKWRRGQSPVRRRWEPIAQALGVTLGRLLVRGA